MQLDATLRTIAPGIPAVSNPQDPAPAPVEPQDVLARITGLAGVELTAEEARAVQRYHESRLIMASAGAVAMICNEDCPNKSCPLSAIGKAPRGEECPLEVDFMRQRFAGWLREINRTLDNLLESERISISTLCWIECQEQRCLNIMSQAKEANLQQKSVRAVDEDGRPACWEYIIHTNEQILLQLGQARRMILKDFELTPEMKTKKRKVDGPLAGGDLSSMQADKLDRLRAAQKNRTIELVAAPTVR